MSLKAGRVGVNPEDVDELGHIRGGGGTEVVPNPEGEATETLTKLGVDGTVFGVGGGDIECKLLATFNHPSGQGAISLTVNGHEKYTYIGILFWHRLASGKEIHSFKLYSKNDDSFGSSLVRPESSGAWTAIYTRDITNNLKINNTIQLQYNFQNSFTYDGETVKHASSTSNYENVVEKVFGINF